jgi:signal peptidase I
VIRWITRALAIVVFVVIAVIVLDFAELLVPVEPDDTASMANTIPACDGRVLAQGVSYRLFADPEPGEVVAVHAAEEDDGTIVPDRDADDRTLVLRIAAGPGEVIVGRAGSVFVDDVKFDDIETEPFGPVTVPNEQYFLLGDNRSAAIDSRTFGPVLGNAIFARVFAVYWPARDITFRLDRGEGPPPGAIDCNGSD